MLLLKLSGIQIDFVLELIFSIVKLLKFYVFFIYISYGGYSKF